MKGCVSNESLIAHQALLYSEEFLRLHKQLVIPIQVVSQVLPPRVWLPQECGVLKVNTNVIFAKSRIDIGIIVHNHLGIPLLAKVLTREGRFSVKYEELQGIIGSYVACSSLLASLIIERNSFFTVSSLVSRAADFSELGALSSYFLNSIDPSNTIFPMFIEREIAWHIF